MRVIAVAVIDSFEVSPSIRPLLVARDTGFANNYSSLKGSISNLHTRGEKKGWEELLKSGDENIFSDVF